MTFINELKALLEKHNVSITADDHWTGYAECGQDIRITVEFNDYTIDEIEFGTVIDVDTCDNVVHTQDS